MMDEIIYGIFKVQYDFALEVWFSIYLDELHRLHAWWSNPITIGKLAFLFNCTPVGRTSDYMTVPT